MKTELLMQLMYRRDICGTSTALLSDFTTHGAENARVVLFTSSF